jgi:hypothetical protein
MVSTLTVRILAYRLEEILGLIQTPVTSIALMHHCTGPYPLLVKISFKSQANQSWV